MVPQTLPTLNDEPKKAQLERLVDKLEDDDDVSEVFTSAKIYKIKDVLGILLCKSIHKMKAVDTEWRAFSKKRPVGLLCVIQGRSGSPLS